MRRRVGPGALSEPDLWVTHPALWVSVSQVEQLPLDQLQFTDPLKVGEVVEVLDRRPGSDLVALLGHGRQLERLQMVLHEHRTLGGAHSATSRSRSVA